VQAGNGKSIFRAGRQAMALVGIVSVLCGSCAPKSAPDEEEPARSVESPETELVVPAVTEPAMADRSYLTVREFHAAVREANPGYTERAVLLTDAAKRVVQADLTGGRVKRLEPFADLALTVLDLSDNPVEDLSPLAGMPLSVLLLDNTHVADLTPLEGAKLERLSLVGTPVADLRPLMKAQIASLDLRGTQVVDLTPLSVVPVEELRLDGTKVESVAALTSCPIRRLTLSNTPVRDLSPLQGRPLRVLDISGTGVTDLTPILGCQLHRLVFTRRRIQTGFAELRQMRSLFELGESSGGCRAAPDYWKDVAKE
jgi:internalin A